VPTALEGNRSIMTVDPVLNVPTSVSLVSGLGPSGTPASELLAR